MDYLELFCSGVGDIGKGIKMYLKNCYLIISRKTKVVPAILFVIFREKI